MLYIFTMETCSLSYTILTNIHNIMILKFNFRSNCFQSETCKELHAILQTNFFIRNVAIPGRNDETEKIT